MSRPAPRLQQIDRLAERMANGCPSVMEAARLMRLPASEADRLWKRIVRSLGSQAR